MTVESASAPVRRSAPPVRRRTGCDLVRQCASAYIWRTARRAHSAKEERVQTVRQCARSQKRRSAMSRPNPYRSVTATQSPDAVEVDS